MVRRLLPANKALGQAFLALLLVPGIAAAKKFYDDDPLSKEPPPMNVEKVKGRKISEYYDFFANTLSTPGERNTRAKFTPAGGVNTLGEVPESAWYTNRHYRNPMSIPELVRGPGNGNPPSADGPWVVVAGKSEGVTPGFIIRDPKGRLYWLKFDPLSNPEMTTAADVISAKFFYALGYNVPENYIVHFSRQHLVVGKGTLLDDKLGKPRAMTERDVTEMLLNVPRGRDGRYRAVASLNLEGTWLGPFRYYGTRRDDPNDVVPHEHRRDLRGLSVFCAWLAHDDSRAINTLDMLVEEHGIHLVKHYLIDFGSTLGSASTGPNSPRSGQYLFGWKPAAGQLFTLGLYVPKWARARYPKLPSVGRFEAQTFDPENWAPEYRNPAFHNRFPDDAFWAAKQVMAFSDEQIRAIVKTGEYTDPAAEKWVADCLIARRDKIGRAFFARVLPLDRFEVKEGRLVFEDLKVRHKLITSRHYTIQWSRFSNDTEQQTPLAGETTFVLPQQVQEGAAGEHFAAEIHGGDQAKTVTVYLRKKMGRLEVVGIERTW